MQEEQKECVYEFITSHDDVILFGLLFSKSSLLRLLGVLHYVSTFVSENLELFINIAPNLLWKLSESEIAVPLPLRVIWTATMVEIPKSSTTLHSEIAVPDLIIKICKFNNGKGTAILGSDDYFINRK